VAVQQQPAQAAPSSPTFVNIASTSAPVLGMSIAELRAALDTWGPDQIAAALAAERSQEEPRRAFVLLLTTALTGGNAGGGADNLDADGLPLPPPGLRRMGAGGAL
jgi:hypothetical protein